MKNDEAIIWKSVNGLDGLYEISNLGSVRRVRVDRKGKVSYKYIKPETKYGRVSFSKDNKVVRRTTINQLMYEHFGIPTLEGEVWKSSEYEHIKISNFKRVYNTRTAHFLEGENVKVTRMSLNAFGLPSDEDEQWKEIEGYEGLYKVSDKGRVVSIMTGKILKPLRVSRNDSYLRVVLYKDKKYKYHMVHRLVAQAFIFNPNPQEYDQVNHKDQDPSNNCKNNLEWCDCTYNNNYGDRKERAGKAVSETWNKKRQERLANCETEEEREKVLKAIRQAEYDRQRYLKHKNQ